MHLYKLAQMTNQVKENIIFWLNQEETFNPADKLGKFDIDKDPVNKWTSLALKVLHPEWLQGHPKHYLHKMLKESSEIFKEVRSGGSTEKPTNKEAVLTHHCTKLSEDENIMASYMEVQDYIKPTRKKKLDFHPLDIIVRRNGTRGSSRYMKIMGYVTYFAPRWVDKLYLKNTKFVNTDSIVNARKIYLPREKSIDHLIETPVQTHS